MHLRSTWFGAAAALWLACAAPAMATVVIVPTFDEMSVKSEVIVHAVVVDQEVKNEGGRVVTLTKLEVKDGIKGARTGDVLTVFQVGGQKDGHNAWITGAHRFHKGEELVMFAVHMPVRGPGTIVPYGIGYGLFRVQEDVDGKSAVEIIGDVQALERTPQGAKETRLEARSFRSLEVMKNNIRHANTLAEPLQMPLKQKLQPRLPAKKSTAAVTPQHGG